MRRVAVVAALLVALTSGCGGSGSSLSAEDRVPALTTGLARVDAALAAHEFAVARKDLRALRATVQKARRSDTLSASEAARVLGAVDRLLAVLPSTTATPTAGAVSSSPTPSSAPTHRRPRPTATPTHPPTSAEPSPSSSPTTPEPSQSPSATAESSATAAGATATP
jgi:hypothetical protein